MRLRTYILVAWMLAAATVAAQEPTAGYGREHTNVLKLRAGYGRQLDTYLSLLSFQGYQVGLGNEWWQSFRQPHWEHVGRVDLNVFRYTPNPPGNRITGLLIGGGWGALYRWKWLDERLQVHAGPYLEAEFGVRYLGNNVNKPLSMDIAVDVKAMGGVSWSFYGKKNSYRLNYLIRTNLIGFDYVPEYGQSYYELYSGVPGIARCAGHWNHNTVKHELSLDLQFPHSTWRVGAEHHFNSYRTDYLHFTTNQIGLIVGCIWKYRLHAHSRL